MQAALTFARARSVPAWLIVLALACGYAALWGAGMAIAHPNPTLDNAEQLVWSYAMEPGYWKHPPLPSWILYLLVQVFGPSAALTYYAALACVGLALALAWRLGCEFMSPERSLVAAALTTLVAYHGFGAESFNHNNVLLPLQAAMTLGFYLATRKRSWGWWAFTGAAAAGALLVKYVAVFPAGALVLYFLVDRRLHERRQVAGLLLAMAVAAALCAPHVLWLLANGLQPLHYMQSVTAPVHGLWQAIYNPGQFLFGQLLRVLPLLAAVGWLFLRQGPATSDEGISGRDRLFLWMAGVGPLALVLGYALVAGTELQPRWGTPLFLLSGWLALDLMRGRTLPQLAPTLRAVALLQLLLWLGIALVAPQVREALQLRGRARFPAAAMASMADTTWRQHTGRPLHFVVSDTWLAGNLVAQLRRPLAVLVDGEPSRAPWVDAVQLMRCGGMVMHETGPGAPEPAPAVARALAAATTRGEWQLPWIAHDPEPSRIAWGILPPTGANCAR